ncbi:hypothetical protein D9M71_809940 [compost metagenome]
MDAAGVENAVLHLAEGRSALAQAVAPARLVVADQQFGGAAAEQLFPVAVLGMAIAEGESRQQYAVEEALQ